MGSVICNKDYFRKQSKYTSKYLITNLDNKDDYQKLMDFLNIESKYNDFSWENKTADLN